MIFIIFLKFSIFLKFFLFFTFLNFLRFLKFLDIEDTTLLSASHYWTLQVQTLLVKIYLINKSLFAKCVTVGLLFHFPIVFLDWSTSSVLTFNTYSVFEPSNNVLLWFNFSSRVYGKVRSSISWTTSLNFNGTSSRCSTHGNIRVCEENRISAGNGNQSSRINISYFLVGMHNCL